MVDFSSAVNCVFGGSGVGSGVAVVVGVDVEVCTGVDVIVDVGVDAGVEVVAGVDACVVPGEEEPFPVQEIKDREMIITSIMGNSVRSSFMISPFYSPAYLLTSDCNAPRPELLHDKINIYAANGIVVQVSSYLCPSGGCCKVASP